MIPYRTRAVPVVCALAVGVLGAGALAAASSPAASGDSAAVRLTLEQIMADPDWIGPPVRDAYWSVDGRWVYYSLKRVGSPLVDLHRVEVAAHRDQVIDAKAMETADGPAVFDRAGKRAAFVRNGDVFMRDLVGQHLTQITRTPQNETSPQWSADGRRLSFRVDQDWYVYDPASGVTAPAAIVKTEKDPDAAPKDDDLRDVQLRLFATLKKQHDDKELMRRDSDRMSKQDASRAPVPFYLGEDVSIVETSLSPDARWRC